MRNQWRVGSSLGRTLYIQAGDEPAKSDHFLGILETRELAQQVVDAVNAPSNDSRDLGLTEELRMVLNRYSAENESNTPDAILAEFLLSTLAGFNFAVRDRDRWYRIKPSPGWTGGIEPGTHVDE